MLSNKRNISSFLPPNFTGPMAEAFKLLTGQMYKKGPEPFLEYKKFKQNFKEAADE